jgi:hypothetical protein
MGVKIESLMLDHQYMGTKKGPISGAFKAWCGAGLNRRHMDFQSIALPTELPHHPFSDHRRRPDFIFPESRDFDRVAKIGFPAENPK